ncbi:GFA family protein [Desertibaculum subflavum]|uniref:GFA family protein n=1 Tax=Desertibaculum subflavum TaxID=2268458 RepID=UPI000E65FF96
MTERSTGARPVTGGCLCGAVRFECDEPPVMARACWCRVCQYLSSGNASINVALRTATFRVTGALGEYRSTADSGNRMRRRYCAACGTPLFSESDARPGLIVVRAGALDDPELGRPSGYIWTGSAPSWARIDPGLANCEGQPPPAASHR